MDSPGKAVFGKQMWGGAVLSTKRNGHGKRGKWVVTEGRQCERGLREEVFPELGK